MARNYVYFRPDARAVAPGRKFGKGWATTRAIVEDYKQQRAKENDMLPTTKPEIKTPIQTWALEVGAVWATLEAYPNHTADNLSTVTLEAERLAIDVREVDDDRWRRTLYRDAEGKLWLHEQHVSRTWIGGSSAKLEQVTPDELARWPKLAAAIA